MPHIHIAVFIESCIKNSSAILPEEALHVSSSTKEGHTEGGLCDNHILSLSLSICQVFYCIQGSSYYLIHIIELIFAKATAEDYLTQTSQVKS